MSPLGSLECCSCDARAPQVAHKMLRRSTSLPARSAARKVALRAEYFSGPVGEHELQTRWLPSHWDHPNAQILQ
jgi:hypothetical protein